MSITMHNMRMTNMHEHDCNQHEHDHAQHEHDHYVPHAALSRDAYACANDIKSTVPTCCESMAGSERINKASTLLCEASDLLNAGTGTASVQPSSSGSGSSSGIGSSAPTIR